MRNLNLKPFAYLIVCISGGAWFIIAYASGLDLSKASDFFSLIPKVVTIDLALIGIFIKWGWSLHIFRGWLVPFPDLNGTWEGFIYLRQAENPVL